MIFTRIAATLTFLIGILFIPSAANAATGGAVIPGQARADATLDSIGLYWPIQGDDNLNSTMVLEYRQAGSATWQLAAPAMRAEPLTVANGSMLGLNYWAASALFLEQGTSYELRATITDPDGGGTTTTLNSATTASLTNGHTFVDRYVAPGSGGGSGSATDPFLGLQAAADAAEPGNRFIVTAGTYDPFTLTTSGQDGAPIVFTNLGDVSDVVIDGDDINSGVVTIGRFDRITSYVSVSNFTIRNGRWGVDAQNTQYLDIIGNYITDVGFGVYNRRDKDQERHQVVCDNTITGRTPWPGSGIPSERGIDLRGWGHTVCNNTVSNFGDCVSVQPFTGPSYGNDVYGNDASRCVDDGIEVDYNQANVRVWANRVVNARMGVSIQPIRGGPAYVLRNELVNLESNSIKINNDPSGFLIAHNTAIKLNNAFDEGSSGWTNGRLRNNALFGNRYAFELSSVSPSGFRDFDYNGWSTTRTGSDPWFKWENMRYTRLGDLPPGVEDHGVELALSDLMNASLPVATSIAVDPDSVDLRPKAGSPLVNAGQVLPNINDLWVSDGQPDLGVYELGQPLTTYGPGSGLGNGGGNDGEPTPRAVEEMARNQLSDQVTRLYQAYLQRPPDAAGLAYWRAERASPTALQSISEVFADSPEFRARYGQLSNAQFVDLIYANVLDREPDVEGRAYWNTRLETDLTRGGLMVGFSESAEFVAKTGTVRPATITEGRIWRLYKAYFLRDAEQEGFDYWLAQSSGGLLLREISDEFALSDEFTSQYGQLTDAEFVDLVYRNVLDRSPDPSGRTYWISRLESGLNRGELMIGFSDSVEFVLSTDTLPSSN